MLIYIFLTQGILLLYFLLSKWSWIVTFQAIHVTYPNKFVIHVGFLLFTSWLPLYFFPSSGCPLPTQLHYFSKNSCWVGMYACDLTVFNLFFLHLQSFTPHINKYSLTIIWTHMVYSLQSDGHLPSIFGHTECKSGSESQALAHYCYWRSSENEPQYLQFSKGNLCLFIHSLIVMHRTALTLSLHPRQGMVMFPMVIFRHFLFSLWFGLLPFHDLTVRSFSTTLSKVTI